METEPLRRLFVSIDDAAEVLGIGKSRIKALCYDDTLPSVKIGRRRLIPYDALKAYADALIKSSGNGNGEKADR